MYAGRDAVHVVISHVPAAREAVRDVGKSFLGRAIFSTYSDHVIFSCVLRLIPTVKRVTAAA